MQTERNARRVKAKNRRGVYYRDTANGRRYEITFLDSTGRRRWQTLEGGLREADAALEDVKAKMRRSERVAPSKLTLADCAEVWREVANVKPSTLRTYEGNLREHVVPRLGRVRVSDVNEDDAAKLVAEMRAAGYAGWTIRGVLARRLVPA